MSLLDRETRTCPDCGQTWEALSMWSQDMACVECGTKRYIARLAAVNEARPYTVESIGGGCPTQAEGRTADDRPFYFRARHGNWTLDLGPVGAPTHLLDWPDGGEKLIAEGDDPSGGLMEWEDVLAILDAHFGAES